MAKTIATITGTALVPGTSRNGRRYTREAIARAVARGQERIARGSEPLTMLTHHAAEDDSTRIVGKVTKLTLGENGEARYTADIADTPHGRVIAGLVDSSDGKPGFLSGVSIRGAWVGRVRKERDESGEPVETAADLELDGLDFTRKPGVPDARVDTFAWAQGDATETDERVAIYESVQEARVTISEEAAPATEGAAAQTAAPAGTVYADPGYLKDKKKRYPLNREKRIRAAWSYINQKDNAAQYTAAQLKRIKGKIRAAMKRIGATVTDEGWVIWPAEMVTESGLGEHYGDVDGDGSFSISASNGPITICVSSYCVDPADLELILRASVDAACLALKSIDPDMDADIDVPGVGPDSDTDGDAGETAEDDEPVTETEDPAPIPAAAATEEQEPPMGTTETAGGLAENAQIPVSDGNPGPTGVATNTNDLNNNDTTRNRDDDVAGNSFESFLQDMIELICRQALADGKMNPAYTQLAARLAASQALGMSGPQMAASVASRGAGSVPAPPVSAESAPEGAAVTETEAQMIERIVAAKLAAQNPPPVEETAEQRIERLVNERLMTERARLTESGAGPVRKGLVRPVTETAAVQDVSAIPADWPQKPLAEYTPQEWKQFVEPHVATAVFGGRGTSQPA